MKTPEEWIKGEKPETIFWEDYAGGAYAFNRESDVRDIIEKAQKEAWNEALDWAVSNVKLNVEMFGNKDGSRTKEEALSWYDGKNIDITVSKQSILKGKK